MLSIYLYLGNCKNGGFLRLSCWDAKLTERVGGEVSCLLQPRAAAGEAWDS